MTYAPISKDIEEAARIACSVRRGEPCERQGVECSKCDFVDQNLRQAKAILLAHHRRLAERGVFVAEADARLNRAELSTARAEIEEVLNAATWANMIEAIAFEIPPPNRYTPRLIQAVVGLRAALAPEKGGG